jgi:hypothetical protein
METTALLTSRLTKDNFLKFILAGNAHVTFRNIETGNRYTYRIRASKDKSIYFVGLLCGIDNADSYSYIGVISPATKQFRWTIKSRYKEDSTGVLVFKSVYNHILKNDLPSIIEVWHEGRCCRCGRLLTVPESIESGIGPECARISNF